MCEKSSSLKWYPSPLMTYKWAMPNLGPGFPCLFLPFSKPMWGCILQSQAGMQSWKGYRKHSVGWSKWKIGRGANTLWFPGIIHSQGHTCTAVGRKIAVGMMIAADVCLSFLILTKALLLSSLLLPCCCSFRWFFCALLVHVNTFLPREEEKDHRRW